MVIIRFEADDFDSADLEEGDPDHCVGVDERAEDLDPEQFLSADDMDWQFNAVWLFGREKTVKFLSDALVFHLAPLYVPYAPITAKCPEEIVPLDVKEDIFALMEQFVDHSFESTMSVADVKHSLAGGAFTTQLSTPIHV
jgi:hypothetical protein